MQAVLVPSAPSVSAFIRYCLFFLVAISTNLFAQSESSKLAPDSFDVEPPLLIRDRDIKPSPDSGASPIGDESFDLAKLEKQFERAKRTAANADRLCKIGALSKLEAEQRVLRAVHLEFELANARLVCAKEQMLEKEKQLNAGAIATADVTPAENNLALAIEAAHAATIRREQVDIDAAEANVQRQEKLLALGSARKSDVERAVEKLTELKSQKP